MKKIQAFLLFSSGADQTILERCPSDINRYTAIGATVFFTGLLAFISASYALYSVFHSTLLAILFGAVWGVMIYNLDRFIVLSLRSTGSLIRDVWIAVPRIVLALLFAVVISTPLELRIFKNEINGELDLMDQEQQKKQEDATKARFTDERLSLLETRSAIESEIAALRTKSDELALMALQEADGTGGSMKKNLGPIYAAKKQEAERAFVELNQKQKASQPLLQNIETGLARNFEEEQKAMAALQNIPMNGLIGQLEALGRLTERSGTIFTAHLFIFLLFVALELAPIMVKLISLRSPYDLVLSGHEHGYETAAKVSRHKADEEMHENMEVNASLIKHRTAATIEGEKAIIDRKLKEKLQKVKDGVSGWDKAFG